jgi:hypothetical protein
VPAPAMWSCSRCGRTFAPAESVSHRRCAGRIAVHARMSVAAVTPAATGSPGTWSWPGRPDCRGHGKRVVRYRFEYELARMVRANASAWRQVLTQAGDARQRRSPGTWSALEYGCHVRDVLRLYDQRLEMMLTQDGPQYPNWDQDATAVASRYGEQDPATVAPRPGASPLRRHGRPCPRELIATRGAISPGKTARSGPICCLRCR